MTKHWLATTLLISGGLYGVAPAAPDSLDPKALEAVAQMGDYLGSLESFTMEVEDSIDKTNEAGRLLTFHHNRTISVRRPDRVHIQIEGDLEKESIVYDGTMVTVLAEEAGYYAQAETPGTINETLDLLRNTYGVRRPLMDFLYSNASERAKGKIQQAEYIALSEVNGVECHHVAFTAVEGVDFQLWIENDETPVPAKLVVHYQQFPGEPRYVMELKSFTANPTLADDLFEFEPPSGAQKIAFEVSGGGMGGEK